MAVARGRGIGEELAEGVEDGLDVSWEVGWPPACRFGQPGLTEVPVSGWIHSESTDP